MTQWSSMTSMFVAIPHRMALSNGFVRPYRNRQCREAFFPLILAVATTCFVASYSNRNVLSAAEPPANVVEFLNTHCIDCHEGDSAEAKLDLTAMTSGGTLEDDLPNWVRIYDRVNEGEMPPADYNVIERDESAPFLKASGEWLRSYEASQNDTLGRVQGRRLTNLQLERTLHDLLGIDIPLAEEMPDDPRTDGFSTVANGQAMSHFQLQQHMSVVDQALDEAFRRALSPPDEWQRTLHAREIVRRRARSRTREPELIDGKAVVWSSRLAFYGRIPVTTARESGWYRFVVRASSLKRPDDRGVWCTVQSGKCVSSAPLLGLVGGFEAFDNPSEKTFEAWVPEGHMLQIRPGDATLKMARFEGGQVGSGEGEPQNVPGVAIDSIKVERFHRGADDDAILELLFDNLEMEIARDWRRSSVISKKPRRDITNLIHRFARRAFRKPWADADLQPFVDLTLASLDNGDDFVASLRGGYRALLCSPRFLYFQEAPGELDDYAIANRLSYFLWNTMPDEELMGLADAGKLRDPDQIRAQTERMLQDPRGATFIEDFASQWLDLSEIDFTVPDQKLFRDFDFIVQQSMLAETHAFLEAMLEEDLGVDLLIDSDFTFLNSRLASYYGIDGVDGDELRRVALRSEHQRGGVLTHGSVLKITANGTNTSPVIRGVWINERLLGNPIPPPPQSVPAIEPDIRGSKTIREMLAMHRNDDACASCHVKIDPPGFALENFDPAGRWRDRYVSAQKGRDSRSPMIDASYSLSDGREFDNVTDFRKLILDDKAALARNLASQMLTYGTGAPIGFADRESVDALVAETKASGYGFRSILHAVVSSPIFLKK